ncbi:surface antigen, D15 [Candidatus Moduliflexus flocculans]|uniref:Surface antigen, D15 n=1 Tax=Candidatus Moduliflexus flocculans TaxID=1499966 RepID=A0A0S6VZ33_9BACT|nr:surface antigen, D15 [Candidatus Moduliflexus flocculans]
MDASLKATIEEETTSLLDFDENVSSIFVRTRIDRQDTYPFPHSGGLVEIDFYWASQDFGGEVDFSKLSFNWDRYFPIAKKHTFGIRLQGGTDFNTELPAYNQFLLGGRDSFVGYKAEEIRGNNLGILGLEYRYQLLKMPAPIGGSMFFTLIGNAGDVWEKISDVTEDFSPRYGGSAGIGVDTFLGPVTADFSMGDEGRYIFYLSIGKKF